MTLPWERMFLMFEGDEGGGGGGAPPVAPPPTPAPTGDPTGGGQTPPPSPSGQQSPPEFDDIRSFAQAQGYDLSQFQDSRAAAEHLISRARENDQFAQFGQQFAPLYSEFMQWRATRGQPGAQQAPQQQQQQNPYQLPEYNPAWLNMVTQDANGNIVPKPGMPLDIPAKLMQYSEAKRQMQDRFFSDPASFLKPVLEGFIQSQVPQYFQQNVGQLAQQQYVENFIAENQAWLYQHDPRTGQPLRHVVTGALTLSPEGQRLQAYVQQADQMGIQGYQNQANYAMQMLRAEYLQMQGQQPQGQAPQQTPFMQAPPAPGFAPQQQQPPMSPFQAAMQRNAQIKSGFLQSHNRRPSHNASTMPPSNPNAPYGGQNQHQSLAERIRADLKAAGVTDSQISAEPGS